MLAEERSALRALESLELLVVLDLFRSATAEHAHYVLPVKHPFERADVTRLMDGAYPLPFAQYTPPLVDGPPGTLEEWEVFWELAMRLRLPLRVTLLAAIPAPIALWRIVRIAGHRDPAAFERIAFGAVLLLIAMTVTELVAFA